MSTPTPCDVVVIISANAEWRAVEQILPHPVRLDSPLGHWFTAELGAEEIPCVFFHGGWGKIAAAASTQYVIQHCQPRLLVNLGTCGGFDGHVARGAIVLAERTVVYDIHEQMGEFDEHIAHYTTKLDLGWLGDELPADVVRAPIVSADRDLFAADIPRLHRDFGAVVADWESASIAWVAARHGVRTLILRGVSDLVGDAGGEAYDGKLHVFERNTRAILERLINQLPQWIARARPTNTKRP
jgi:adenosylhomocysteine nucleosidase